MSEVTADVIRLREQRSRFEPNARGDELRGGSIQQPHAGVFRKPGAGGEAMGVPRIAGVDDAHAPRRQRAQPGGERGRVASLLAPQFSDPNRLDLLSSHPEIRLLFDPSTTALQSNSAARG